MITLSLWAALTPSAAALPPGSGLLPGTYGLELSLASLADLPFLGSTPGRSLSWSLTTVSATPEGLVQSHKTCAVRMEGRTGNSSVHVPAAFVAALPVRTYPIDLSAGYTADLGLDAVGFDPARGPLPTRIDEHAVIDWDHDGQPGATVELRIPLLGTYQLYVAQQAHIRLEGKTNGADGANGGGGASGGVAYVAFDQHTLGASSAFFDRSPRVAPVPEDSRFTLIPLPAGARCEAVRTAFCDRGLSRSACADPSKE